jgi:hypothetical protein
MNKYRIMDYSYGNLRVIDKDDKILAIDHDTLHKIINSLDFEKVKKPKHRLPHLVLKGDNGE